VPTFEGFTPDAIQFLADLAVNNDRAWFTPRKPEYERLLKEPLERLCEALADRFAARDLPLVADPRRSPFRIYRDTRFARDKAPYKTNVGATFPWISGEGGHATWPADGTRHSGGYFHFEPGGMYVGGGMYMPEKPRLDSFRRAVVDSPERVKEALEDTAFVAWFGGAHPHEALKRAPAGWPADHPMAPLFLWKDVIFGRPLTDAEVCSPDLPDLLADGYAAAAPVFRLLATLD
jgi:uncharacterized protein (TIGR02453 family)